MLLKEEYVCFSIFGGRRDRYKLNTNKIWLYYNSLLAFIFLVYLINCIFRIHKYIYLCIYVNIDIDIKPSPNTLIYNFMLVSDVQQSYICIFFFRFFPIIG